MQNIFENFFIGNWQDAEKYFDNKDWEIITIADNSPVKSNYYFPIIENGLGTNDLESFKQAFDLLENLFDSVPKNILVHCHSGENRAPIFAMIFLMKRKNLSLKNAYLEVGNKLKIMKINRNVLSLGLKILDKKLSLSWKEPEIVLTESEKIVNELYKKLLHREADPDGLKHYAAKLDKNELTVGELDEEFKKSEEYKVKLITHRNNSVKQVENNSQTENLDFYIL